MKRRTTTVKTAIIVGLLCVFALGRLAYAAQQCYRLTATGCGGSMEHVVATEHGESHQYNKVCAQTMAAPDDRGSGTSAAHPSYAIAPLLTLAFTVAPAFPIRPFRHVAVPSGGVKLLTSLPHLRL